MTPSPFDDHDISRRDFVRLSAATGGALALPGNATGALDRVEFSEEYQFVLNHTPTDHAVPTVVEFSDLAGFDALAAIADDDLRTTTETPRPAAYAELTAAEAELAADMPTAETFTHSPGANPFWRIGYYPLGVFPEATRSTDFIDYDENVAGLQHLESEYPDMLNIYADGWSPGHYNYLSDRPDPRPVRVAELTHDVDDREAFAEKEKAVFICSIHGGERAGVEGASRFVENLLRGEEQRVATLLHDVALIFVYNNPDGWAARRPQYESYGAPGVLLHERGNASGVDTNRQYPNVGWVNPGFYPGEPFGRDLEEDNPDGLDLDVPDGIFETVPDALWTVELLRAYENVSYLDDLHGMSAGQDFVYGLVNQARFDHRDFHDMHEWNRTIDEEITAQVDDWMLGETYDWGTIWDTLSYTVPGGLIDWASAIRAWNGLDCLSMANEMALSNVAGGNVFTPQHVDMQVRGYRACIRMTTVHAAREVEATIRTGGDRIGFVEDEDLRADFADLAFVDSDTREYTGSDGETNVETDNRTVTLGERATETFDVEAGLHSLDVDVRPRGDLRVAVEIRDPDGETVHAFDPHEVRAYEGVPSWHVSEPRGGTWTLVLERVDGRVDEVAVDATTTAVTGNHGDDEDDQVQAPDPGHVESWEGGFVPRDYGVADAHRYVHDYEAYMEDGEVVFLPGCGRYGELHSLDAVVIVHDDVSETFLRHLERFLADGGTVVLTDSGVNLLTELDACDAFGESSVERQELFVPHIGERQDDHPLLTDTRPIQRQLYNVVGQGIETGEAPMWLVDPADFEAAGGTSAGTTQSMVAAGSITGDDVGGEVHVVGGLLQPPNQETLHPFGLLDYAVTFLGHTVLANALGHLQVRRVDGEVVDTFGREEALDDGGEDGGDDESGGGSGCSSVTSTC